MNDRRDIGRAALRTQAGRFTCWLASHGQLFHCQSTYPKSQSPGNSLRFAARMAVLDATARHVANRRTGLFINGCVGLFAEFSERLLDQLDGGRGIENFLLIQVDIFDAVLAAVGGGNLLFRDIDP